MRVLGAVKTSIYIYLVPVITVVTSAIILQEPVSLLMLARHCVDLCWLGRIGEKII